MAFFRYLKRLTISDLVLITVCLGMMFFSWMRFQDQKTAKQVKVFKNNELFGSYPLSKDRIVIVDKHNSVEIRNGKAKMLFSDCPDKRCMKQGFAQNLPIICLPNKVVIEFVDETTPRKLILR